MAFPIFRAAGAKFAGTTGATAVAAPSGVADGDLEVLVATTVAGGSVAISAAGGSAWSAMTGSPVDVTSGRELLRVVADSADRGQQPVRHPRGDRVCAGRLAYQAGTFDPDDPFEIEAASAETTSDNSFSWAPGTSTADADRLVLCIYKSILRDSNTASVPVCTNAALSALASRANYCTNSGAGGGFGVTEGAKAAAGSVGTFACTYGASSPKAYLSFAIKPKPAAATVLDTANRANGAVGANSLEAPFDAGLNTLVISSNHFTGSGGTYPDGIWVASTPGADQEVYITVDASVSDEYWFYLRAADSSNFYVIDSTGGGRTRLRAAGRALVPSPPRR